MPNLLNFTSFRYPLNRISIVGSKQRNFFRYLATNQICRQQQASFSVNNYENSMRTTNRLEVLEPSSVPTVAAYRVLNEDGRLIGDLHPNLSTDKILELYRGMLTLNTMDKIMFDSQRQGRISFYMTSFGEEAVQFGSASALEPEDWVFAQYRETGVLIHRKMALKLLMAQCYGNKYDLGKGRQMPIHYGNRSLNFVTISSTLTTQLPQAAGVGYTFKRDGSGRVVMCYFGEGAASEGDAHAAMNFAATLDCPVIFFCRNNGYAISTPAGEQYRSDGIVTRGAGYGMGSIRVDGNDLFAVHSATRLARELSATDQRPILVEALTYRVGHHSTSDDSSAYRSNEEVKLHELTGNPLGRVYRYLVSQNLWSEDMERDARAEARAKVVEAFSWAEKAKKLPISSMFDDVYDELPANLQRQRDELNEHLEKFNQHYQTKDYEVRV